MVLFKNSADRTGGAFDAPTQNYVCMYVYVFTPQVPIEITKLSGDSRGLRLTFLSPKLLDSAYYACFAANQFERQQERVELAVFLPGTCMSTQ